MGRRSKSSKISTSKRKNSVSDCSSTDRSRVQDALSFLKTADNTKEKKAQRSKCLKIVESESELEGLPPEDILSLLDIIRSQKYGKYLRRKLIKCLVPSEHVPEIAVIQAVSLICTQGLPIETQVDLFKWILIVFDFIDETKKLSCLFGVIFHFVEYDILSPYICQLLCKLVESYHVVSFRVKVLAELLVKLGPQPHILALLEVFGSYRPHLISVKCSFKHIFRPLGVLPNVLKQRNDIQRQRTSFCHKRIKDISQIRCKSISTLHELYDIVQNLRGPGNIIKLMESPIRRILFTSYLQRDVLNEFCFWIRTSLVSEFPWKYDSKNHNRKDVLNLVSIIQLELKEGIPEAEHFVEGYLHRWDGRTHFDYILEIIEHWGICSFDEFQEVVLCPIYNHFCSSLWSYKCSIIESLTKLYQYWIYWDIPRYKASINEKSTTSASKPLYIFERLHVNLDPYHEAESLANYIQKLCVVALQLHSDHPIMLMFTILSFFEKIADAHSFDFDAPLMPPPPLVVCASFFLPNSAIICQLCRIMNRFKEEVYSMRDVTGYDVPKLTISIYNACILDMCNMLWCCTAFSSDKDTAILLNKIPPHVSGLIDDASDAFSIYCHPAFLGFLYDFFESMKKVVTPKSIYKDFALRGAYVDHLSNTGMKSVVSFMESFIRQN